MNASHCSKLIWMGDCLVECDELTNLPFLCVSALAYNDGITSLFLVVSILNLSDLNITSSDVTLKHEIIKMIGFIYSSFSLVEKIVWVAFNMWKWLQQKKNTQFHGRQIYFSTCQISYGWYHSMAYD